MLSNHQLATTLTDAGEALDRLLTPSKPRADVEAMSPVTRLLSLIDLAYSDPSQRKTGACNEGAYRCEACQGSGRIAPVNNRSKSTVCQHCNGTGIDTAGETPEEDDEHETGEKYIPNPNDPAAEAALQANTRAKGARDKLERHVIAIRTAVEGIATLHDSWTTPLDDTQRHALREAAENAIEQSAADPEDWCRIHLRAGQNEPITTERPGDALGMCWRCSKLYSLLLREVKNNATAATSVLSVLVERGTLSPTASQVEEAMKSADKVKPAKVTADSGTKPSTRALPGSTRRKGNGAPWHTIDEYQLDGEAS